MTFFITRPPDLKISPRPLTPATPSRWSRAAPRWMRRAPDMLVAKTPPIGLRWPAAAGGRAEVDRLEGQHLPARGELGLDLRERRAGARRHHDLGRLVERDAAQPMRRDGDGGLDRPADGALGAAASSTMSCRCGVLCAQSAAVSTRLARRSSRAARRLVASF